MLKTGKQPHNNGRHGTPDRDCHQQDGGRDEHGGAQTATSKERAGSRCGGGQGPPGDGHASGDEQDGTVNRPSSRVVLHSPDATGRMDESERESSPASFESSTSRIRSATSAGRSGV